MSSNYFKLIYLETEIKSYKINTRHSNVRWINNIKRILTCQHLFRIILSRNENNEIYC